MNKYQSCKIIGKGSSSTVYLVKHLEYYYALKEIKSRNESQKKYLKRISAEFCIGSSLIHDNIIKTFDFIPCRSGKEWCIVLEYCAGGDMLEEMSKRELSLWECNMYFRQVMDGTRYMHSMGVAHRDLKPENLLIQPDKYSREKVIKISDFGNSQVFQEPFSHYKRTSRIRCGTEPYMAPEIFKQGDLDLEPLDIWACGIIFITLYYQRLPWEKATQDDLLFKKYLEGRHTMITAIPSYMGECILGMLEIKVEKRSTLKQVFNNEWFKSLSK